MSWQYSDTETCACGCGEPVIKGRKWRRGHDRKDLVVHPADPVADGECLRWQGAHSGGYGRLRGQLVHRMLWEQQRGPIPEGMDLVAKPECRFRDCVNLDHWEPMTRSAAMSRKKATYWANVRAARGRSELPKTGS